jgi:hypothetical protein
VALLQHRGRILFLALPYSLPLALPSIWLLPIPLPFNRCQRMTLATRHGRRRYGDQEDPRIVLLFTNTVAAAADERIGHKLHRVSGAHLWERLDQRCVLR